MYADGADRSVARSRTEQVVRRGRQFGLLTRRDAEHSFDLRWWSALGPLVASAALIGFGWRAVTAQVIGANIGAGCVILFGGPLVLALLGWAGASAISLT
jgi:hypothetical protein